LGPKKGTSKAFNTSYFVIKALYEVMETGSSKLPGLKGVSKERARAMSVEFISKNKQDFSDELKKFIIAEFEQSGFNSLPGQEER